VLQLDSRYLGARAPHRIDAALAWSRNRATPGRRAPTSCARSARTSTPTPDLWVNSLASFTETELGAGAGGLAFTQRMGQLTSQAVWRPEFDDRLVLTGGGRLFVNQFSRSGPDSTSHSLSGNAGATFSIDDQASLNASMSATQVAVTGGEDALVTVASAGANYVSRPLDLGSPTIPSARPCRGGRQSGGPEKSRIVASAQADQQLARALALGDAVSLNLLATQGGGVTHDSFLGRTDTLRLGASAGVRVATSEASDAYLGASYAQFGVEGRVNDRFRLANVQASGQIRFGPTIRCRPMSPPSGCAAGATCCPTPRTPPARSTGGSPTSIRASSGFPGCATCSARPSTRASRPRRASWATSMRPAKT